MTKRNSAPVAILLTLALLSAACSSSQIVADIDIAANAAAAAVPVVLGATSLSTATQAAVVGYVDAANTGIGCVATAANGGSYSGAVLGCLAGLSVPALPSGTDQKVVEVVQALAADVALLIQKYAAVPTTGSLAVHGVSNAFLEAAKNWKPSKADKRKLDEVKAKVAATKKALGLGKK
jgi:hypothetical protein